MSGWFRRILYFLCILEISSANPTRAPDVIKDEEEIKFQNKLPEDTLELETGVVRRPLNVTNHRIDQLGNSQSPSREDGKHHCPFCKYASNIGASIENQELDSDSAQPYLIIGNIKPVTGETNIITEEDVPQDTNSTWNPQNEIKAILKVPDGSSNGKEYKRCTHSDSVLGGSSQKTELHNLLNNPEVSNNIDFSCCNTLRKILLHALRLEGKCLCSEPRATSPIINITAIKDNDFEKEIIRQEFPPIFIRQQQNTPPKLIDQEKGAGNNLLGKGDTKTIKHNKENRESNSPGTQDEKDNITSFGSGIQDLKTNSNESAVTLNSIHNTSQITDGKIEGYNTNHEKNIDVKQLIVEEDNELSTPLENNTSITETRKQSEPSSEAEEEHVNTSSELSSVNTFATVVPPAGENGVNYSSIKPNVKLEQVSKEYPRESVTKVNYTSTDNTNNGTLGLNVDQVIYNNSLKEELNGNKEKIDHFYNVENYYTTESFLLVMENKELNSTNIPDNLTEMNMQFSEGSTQSNQEQTQVIETQTLNSMIINNYNDSDIIFKEEANQIDGDSLETPAINKDLLQSKSGNHLLENELFLLEREEMFLAENESSTAMIEDRNNFSTTNHTGNWPDVNSMSTTAYELGHNLEIENLLLEGAELKHNTVNPIILTAGPSISPTNLPELSEEPSGENKTQLQDEYNDSQNILKNSHSLDEGGRPSKMPYEDAEILEQTMFQQNTSTDTPINNENFNLTRENYAEISSIDSPRNFTHTQISPRQNSFYNELMVQQTSTTENFIGNKITERVTDITSRDFSPGFEVESLTTESILQEKSSTPGLEVSSVTAKSTSYETTNTELLMENQMPSLSTENTLSINSSDFFKNNKQSSSEEYALGTEYSQYADSDFTTGKPSEIRMSDPIEYNHELIPGEIENISQQSQKAKNVPPNGLEQGNYILGSIQTKSSQTQPTNNHLEGEMMNLATESPSVIKLSDSLGNSRLEETTKIDHQSRNSQDILSEELQQSNNILSLIQTESAQTQTTENPLGREVSTLTTGIPSDIGFNNSMKNNPPGETENMEQLKSGQTENMEQLKRGQIILSGSPEPDNYILGSIQTSEVESSTFPTEHVSTLAYLDMNIGTVATDTSLSSHFKGDKTNQNQHYIFSSAETTTSEVLLSTDKIDKNEVSHETSTGIDYEMDNAEDILKSLIDGFKKTHLSENSEDKNLTDNTEITLMETSTSVTLLESIKELEFSNKPNNEVPINIGTYTDQSKSIKHNFDFDSSADNVESILQNVQISSTSTDDVFLESTTMSSDNVTPTKMSSDDIPATSTSISNITGIQHSSEMNNTLKSHVNFVDYDKYLAVINELHKFSTDNQSTEFESLRDSDSASTLPPYSSFQILNKKDTTAESSLSAINLFTPHPIDDDELTVMSHNSESTTTEAELEKGSDKVVRQNPQEISNPNFVSLLPNDLQTAITNTIDQKSEFDISNTFPAKTTKISIWNNVTPVISDTSSNLRQSLSSRVEPQVNKLNSTDLEEEILSTGNYIVHHVNVSMNDSYEDLNKNLQVTSNTNLHSGNMMLEEFETTTMNTKHLEDNHRDLSFGYPTSKLSEGSKLIESTTIELLKSDNENTDSTQTEISDIHSPLIVCLPQEDSHQLNTDLLGSRFFIQNEANIIELDLVRRNVGLCGCPHNSYELKPKSRVSKADMNLLKSLEGQHISMILRRADKIPDKTADNYETTTGNYYLQEEYLDLDKKKMEMSEITPVKLDANDDKSGNQVLGNKHVGNNKESEEKHSCNCQCLGNLNPTKVMLENKKESQYPRSKDIDRGQERSRKSQIKKLEPESIMKLDKVKSDHEEGANYKRKYNRGRQHSRRLNFPIMVDKDLLKRFNSVYRPYNYFRRS